jgi:hypothetical protein
MKRKHQKKNSRRSQKKIQSRRTLIKKNKKRSVARNSRIRHSVLTKSEPQPRISPASLAALGRMRRDNLSLAQATSLEHIKRSTFLREVGTAVHRSGHGKRWKPSKVDRFTAPMVILTRQGPITVPVTGSIERSRLGRYDIALRKWRAGEDGAEKALRAFRGQKVAGYVLITETKLLIQLEEAGQLDFDTLYSFFGVKS